MMKMINSYQLSANSFRPPTVSLLLRHLQAAVSAQLAWQKAVILGKNEMDSQYLRMEIVYGLSPEIIKDI